MRGASVPVDDSVADERPDAHEDTPRALPRTLTELANHHGTDKGTIGPSDAWGAWNYTDIYEGFLEPYRSARISILEIGLGVTGDHWASRIVHGRNSEGGASVKLWRDYFTKATIYGIDVNSASYLDDERIHTFVADQGDPDKLRAFMEDAGQPQFDIVIDDGSHRPHHQQISLEFFFPHLKPHGLYIIEDLNERDWGCVDGSAGAVEVRNTRSVLSSFKETGRFATPNALREPRELAEEIASISFHAPKFDYWALLFAAARRVLLRRKGALVKYRTGTERLCVLRKRGREDQLRGAPQAARSPAS